MNATVQNLARADAGAVLRHLRELAPEDRALRFGGATSDAALERYVGAVDFTRDALFGLFVAEQTLAGLAHLVLDRRAGAAELGLSVARESRGKGYGYALLSVAAADAAKRGLRRLHMHCLAENRVVIHLARKAGMTIVRNAAESDAQIALPAVEGNRSAPRGMRVLEWLAIMRGAWEAR